MTDDRIELVDGEYGQCVEERPARQIRTRALSFHNIKAKFTAFRIARLQDKLETKVEKALTAEYTDSNYERKIEKSANVIARLEEKIMILSKMDVPTDYVSRRAIKLRKNMIENLTYHTTNYYGSLYTIGLEHRDEVMGPEMVMEDAMPEDAPVEEYVSEDTMQNEMPAMEEVPEREDVVRPVLDTEPVQAAAIPNNDEIDVEPSDLDRQSIVDAINEGFSQVNAEDAPVIDPVDVPNPVASEETPAPAKEEVTIDKEAIREAVEEAFRKLQAEKTSFDEHVVEAVPETPETVRVSTNNTSYVHTDQFDEEGNRVRRPKKYDYTPMTDEEIREAQVKLGFDEHGNLIDKETPEKVEVEEAPVIQEVPIEQAFVPADPSKVEAPVREVPIVAPEREEGPSIDLEDEPNMFDIIPEAEEAREVSHQETASTERTMTIDDYESLKEKILQLKKQKEESQQQKMDAEKRAQEAAREAEEAKVQYEASQASYLERMNMLRAYAESLEAACDENERGIEAAERESRESEGILQSQRAEIDRTNKIVSEIDSMMEANAENDKPTIKKA